MSLPQTETLLDHGVAGSIGRFGTAPENALMASTIGLYKAEVIRPGSRAWTSRQEVESATTAGWRGSTSAACIRNSAA